LKSQTQQIDGLRRRVRVSNTIAVVALFASLGGGVYAASKIDGSQIKKASIAGSKLKANTVRGSRILESSLGKVQGARTADTAQTLAGRGPGAFVSAEDIKRLRFDVTKRETAPPETQDVLKLGPLLLTAECDPGDFPTDSGTFTLRGSTSATGAGFDIGLVRDTNSTGTGGGFLGSTPQTLHAVTVRNGTARLVGTLVYNDPTTTITVPFAIFVNDDLSGDTRCFFTGTATRATG
jgi:hypothetical protein